MLTKAKRILSKIISALCAVTLLLGILVLSTSAQEPTERTSADNPYGSAYEPITETYLYRIPITLSTSKGQFSTTLYPTDFIGNEILEYGHNFAWLGVTYEGQDDNGDLTTYTLYSPFADCYYLAYGQRYEIDGSSPYYSSVYKSPSGSRSISFSISYEGVAYPDSIVEAYVYIGLNPLHYGYESNTSGGNTDEAFQNGYNTGLSQGYSNGYEEGYSNGYDTASSQIENSNYIKDLGEGFFNGLVDTFLTLYDVPIFGTTLGEIIGYIITALVVLLLVKVVAFVV